MNSFFIFNTCFTNSGRIWQLFNAIFIGDLQINEDEKESCIEIG